MFFSLRISLVPRLIQTKHAPAAVPPPADPTAAYLADEEASCSTFSFPPTLFLNFWEEKQGDGPNANQNASMRTPPRGEKLDSKVKMEIGGVWSAALLAVTSSLDNVSDPHLCKCFGQSYACSHPPPPPPPPPPSPPPLPEPSAG